VIALYLLGVVVDEFLDVGLYELNFGENVVGGGRPCEGLGVGVLVVDVVADLFDQDGDRGEGAASDGLTGDDAEPGLDLVDPGRADRVKWKCTCRLRSSHALTSGGGVRGQVVQYDVHVGARRSSCASSRRTATSTTSANSAPCVPAQRSRPSRRPRRHELKGFEAN
jgi:hypothetical protein